MQKDASKPKPVVEKNASYYKAAIQYNDELAVFAKDLSDRLEHEEVSRWAMAVSKQHRHHANKHERLLAKLNQMNEQAESAPEEQEV